MKIKKIQLVKNSFNKYEVTFQPNWLEKIFGVKEHTEQYKDTGNEYAFGGGSVYLKRDGSKLGNRNWIGVEIDKYKNIW